MVSIVSIVSNLPHYCRKEWLVVSLCFLIVYTPRPTSMYCSCNLIILLSFRDSILKQVETKLNSSDFSEYFLLIASSIYYHEQV